MPSPATSYDKIEAAFDVELHWADSCSTIDTARLLAATLTPKHEVLSPLVLELGYFDELPLDWQARVVEEVFALIWYLNSIDFSASEEV